MATQKTLELDDLLKDESPSTTMELRRSKAAPAAPESEGRAPVERKAESPETIHERAVRAQVAGRFREAIGFYQRYLSTNPTKDRRYGVLLKIARCYEALKNRGRAATYYRQVVQGGGALGREAAAGLQRLGRQSDREETPTGDALPPSSSKIGE